MNPDNPLDPVIWARLGVAVACGAAVGLERQLRGKPVGIRTSVLICLGAMLYVALGADLGGPGADPTRVLGQMVVGVGFLGGGVILTREGSVKGMTSAAVIWILAGIGSVIAFDHYAFAGILTGLVLFVLVGVDRAERVFRALRRGDHAEPHG